MEYKGRDLQGWLDYGSIERKGTAHVGEGATVLPTRWSSTWKQSGTASGAQRQGGTAAAGAGQEPAERKAKARLVILGRRDTYADEQENSSPTLNRFSRQLLFQYAALLQFVCSKATFPVHFCRDSVIRDSCTPARPRSFEQSCL